MVLCGIFTIFLCLTNYILTWLFEVYYLHTYYVFLPLQHENTIIRINQLKDLQ